MLFRITALADSQALARILEHFALRDLIPQSFKSRLSGDALDIEIRYEGLDESLATLIAEKLRAGVLIRSVDLSSTHTCEA